VCGGGVDEGQLDVICGVLEADMIVVAVLIETWFKNKFYEEEMKVLAEMGLVGSFEVGKE
jgi:hypothetical protein